ncbi:MAG: hypothetical protein RDV41_13535, partial [Planctomycetota bacterium]|nr:hypothetical protein [Planctomycetota bacterium]
MAEDRYRYLKKAFWNWHNLIPLIGLGVASVITENWGFLALAGGLESLWLYFLPQNRRFQRSVDAEANKEKKVEAEQERELMVRRLSQHDQERYRELDLICRKVQRQIDVADSLTRPMLEQSLLKLDYLLASYLRMMCSLASIGEYLNSTSSDDIEESIKKLERDIKQGTTSDKVREVKKSNLDVLNQRLARVKRAEENRALLEANLQTLEDTLKLIRDDALTMANPAQVSAQIDNVIVEMQ